MSSETAGMLTLFKRFRRFKTVVKSGETTCLASRETIRGGMVIDDAVSNASSHLLVVPHG